MTQEDMKKLYKKICSIEDPFGTGYPCLKKIRQDTAIKYGISEFELYQLYTSWKSGRN